MTPAGKIIVVGGTLAAVGGLAYYFLVYKKNQGNASSAIDNIINSVSTINNNNAGTGVTTALLKSKTWTNIANGKTTNGNGQPLNGDISDFDPNTNKVSNVNTAWQGVLVDKSTIQWTKIAGDRYGNQIGEQQVWKSNNPLSGIENVQLKLR